VFRIDERTTLVQTVDFFTPVVDDPEAFGAIAAANALSDVYAMGGRPLTALSIACFPEKDFPAEWGAAIFRGGQRKLIEAGCVLLGGHTVRDPEIKFGYAVTGLVDVDQMMTNAAGSRSKIVRGFCGLHILLPIHRFTCLPIRCTTGTISLMTLLP
jgi:selenide,water dikinase